MPDGTEELTKRIVELEARISRLSATSGTASAFASPWGANNPFLNKTGLRATAGINRIAVQNVTTGGPAIYVRGKDANIPLYLRGKGTSSVFVADSGVTGVVVGGASAGLAFYNGGTVAKQTITGSRGGIAALTSLLNAMASLGIITDSSSA